MENGDKPYRKYRSSRVRTRSAPLSVGSEEKEPRRRKRRPKKKEFGWEPEGRRRSWWKIIGVTLLVLLGILLIATAVSYWRLDRSVRASNDRVPADVADVLSPATGGLLSNPVNILFLGSDQRPGEPARADTLLLMRVDGQDKTISQLSIPRDTLADIPGYGEGKINSAYAYGGPALQIQAIEDLTGIPINHYVELDFSGFPDIVDGLGGVQIDVPKTIDSQYPEGLEWTQVHFDQGPQEMDGERALIYVRVRYSDDDFQRMGRQQQFMEALQKKMTSPTNIIKMPVIAPRIIDNITTDLSTNELMKLAWVKFRTSKENSRSYTLIGSSQYIGDGDFVVLDEDANQALIREFLGD